MLNKNTMHIDKTVFQNASPFPHVCLDDFLDPSFANDLHDQFPSPERDDSYYDYCIEDGGARGTNYANPDPLRFPPAFKKLDKLFSSSSFLNHLSNITGIDDLIYDPDYQGGGLRASENQAFLPIHLDFNRHPKVPKWHRRINLLYYLNHNWSDEKGGHIQVHRDPQILGSDVSLVNEFAPIFNRAFIFETSESSWHGFRKLNLNDGERRKCFSIYFYTLQRPEGDIPFRNTEYVEPPLPPALLEKLSEDDRMILRNLIRRRDDRIALLYKLRREFDGKYSDLWAQYEYYHSKYKAYREKFGDFD